MIEDDLEELELDLLLTAIQRRYGYDYREYARPSLRRRVKHAAQMEGVLNLSEYQARILRDPGCMQRFVTRVSVNWSEMFRDPEFFAALRSLVIPALRTYPFVRIWHAGCASGEEVFSLAILLTEAGIYDKCRLYATDLNDKALTRAASGVFPLSSMQAHTANYIASSGLRDFASYYNVEGDSARFAPYLARNMTFARHNLASDATFNEFQLILCRNVLIYFTADLRARVLRLIHDSLCRHGVLGLGLRESLESSPWNHLFAAIDGRMRLYRRSS